MDGRRSGGAEGGRQYLAANRSTEHEDLQQSVGGIGGRGHGHAAAGHDERRYRAGQGLPDLLVATSSLAARRGAGHR